MEDVPTKEELKKWIELSGKEVKKFFNTSGMLYRQGKVKEKLPNMTLDEKLELLSSNGMMIKRPILVGDDFCLVGFKEKEYEEHIKG